MVCPWVFSSGGLVAFEMVRQCESDGVTDNLVNASKAHLLEVAEQLDVTGRSRMTKAELVDALDKANRRATSRAGRTRPAEDGCCQPQSARVQLPPNDDGPPAKWRHVTALMCARLAGDDCPGSSVGSVVNCS